PCHPSQCSFPDIQGGGTSSRSLAARPQPRGSYVGRIGAPGRTRLREHLEGVRLSNRSPRQPWPAKDFRRSVKPPPAPPSRVAPESDIRCPSEPGAGDEREH